MINALTIDVEDYFQVANFEKTIGIKAWEKYEIRVVSNTNKILGMLNKFNVKATFFVLGWIAERSPELIKKIYLQGHEIASHGYSHRLIYQQKQEEFREDIRRSKNILEGIIQDKIIGYRAPNYSITKDNIWAIDIISKEGFKYDSSIFPIHHDKGGLPTAKRYPHKFYNKGCYVWEFPISTYRIFGWNFPFSGGGYFRLLPYNFIKMAIKSTNREGFPVNIYIHPWELDVKQPRIKTNFINKFRHYVNISHTEKKLEKLLKDFKFKPIREIIF